MRSGGRYPNEPTTNTRPLLTLAASVLALAGLCGCSRGASAPTPATHANATAPTAAGSGATAGATTTTATAPWIELAIDGKRQTIQEYDDPTGRGAMLSLVHGTDIVLSVLSQPDDFVFTLTTRVPSLVPGTYRIYHCRSGECDEAQRIQTASLIPYPNGKMPDPGQVTDAYDFPQLGLQPFTLTITEVGNPMFRDGIGMVRHVRGTFSGLVAAVDTDKADPRLLAKPRQIEGRFDMDAVPR